MPNYRHNNNSEHFLAQSLRSSFTASPFHRLQSKLTSLKYFFQRTLPTFASPLSVHSTPMSSMLFESMPLSSTESPVSPQHFSSDKKFTLSSPSYTSLSLPAALLNSFPSSKSILKTSNATSNCLSFTLFQSFYVSTIAIASRYNSNPPPTEIIYIMSKWKETPTVSGLIVHAAESNPHIKMLEKFQVLYLLAFASKSFLMKIACVISESQNEIIIAGRLLKFIKRR